MGNNPKVLIWKNKIWESRGSNLGDLAIIKAMIDALKQFIPDIEIFMLSDDPEYTAKLYGIKAMRIGLKNIVKMMRQIDLLVLGGGTVFTDASSLAIIPINTSLLYLARLFKKPIAAYGIGTGKISRFGSLLVKGIINSFEFVTVRDEDSYLDLKAMSRHKCEHIRITDDAAFSLTLESGLSKKQNRVVIAPRRIFHYKNSLLPFYLRRKFNLLPEGYADKLSDFIKLLADMADYVVEKYDSNVTFLPMYSGLGSHGGISGYLKSNFSSRDDIICMQIQSHMRHGSQADVFLSDNPQQVARLLMESRMAIGVPLHLLILSHMAGTPFIGLNYQEKVSRFMRRVGLEEFIINVDSMDSRLDRDEFRRKIDNCIGAEIQLRSKIRKLNEVLKRKSLIPAEMVGKVLNEMAGIDCFRSV